VRCHLRGVRKRVTIRILVVDDHPIVRTGLTALLTTQHDLALVAEGRDGLEAVALYDLHKPDVTLMDIRMPRMDGVAAISAIRERDAKARILALTTYEGDADIHRALSAGAVGYLIKDTLGREVIGAVRAAARGERVIPPAVARALAEFTPRVDLTEREVEVLCLAGKGLRNKEIARVIGRTEETIKVHLKHIMSKLGASDRTEAVTVALQRGIIHLYD
jgi:DNA-binding NarL/FixJ family response regulator